MIAFLGKIFFPNQAAWQQRTNVLVFVWAITTGTIAGVLIAIGTFLMLRNLR